MGLGVFPLNARVPLSASVLCRQLVVALIALVAIGGATRVMQAGLACPDWPLCYGSLLPARQMNLQVFLEWFHRLDAFLVGIGLIVLLALSLLERCHQPRWLPWLSAAALLLVALLSSAATLLQPITPGPRPRAGAPLAALAGLLIYLQCIAGALMATQWASGRCLRLAQGCAWLSAHRALATPVAAVALVSVLVVLIQPAAPVVRRLFSFAGLLVVAQVLLGVFTLRLALAEPLVTVGHQLIAALLIATFPAAALSLRPSPLSVSSHG